ncbi:MAG: carboxypeptidase regulatory-like domain-containing protein [Planctomycetes bacterium]|nr:carboxypeptidase regulatory-like domain-containing protein [Planctomycetota bacterium]
MKRALLLTVAIAAVGAVIYFAAFTGGPSRVVDAPAIEYTMESDSPKNGDRDVAVASDASAAERNESVDVDVLIWRTSDVESLAPNSTFGMLGNGKSATLRGRLTDGKNACAGATLKFVEGLNEGVSSTTNEHGGFEIPRLYPCVGMIEIESYAKPKIRREVRLLPKQTGDLTIDFGNWGNVRGQLFDEDGKPVAGARVEIDGSSTTTEKDGAFFFSSVVPGNLIIYFSAPGRETRRESIMLFPGQALEFDENRFILRKGEALSVVIDPLPLNAVPPRIVLLPNDESATHTFPFEKIGVVSPRPGEREVKIEGIPVGEWFQVRAFSDAGVANPAMRPVLLKAGDTNLSRAQFSFVWKFPISGTVVSSGNAVANARVRIESCDIGRAMGELLQMCGGQNQIIVPILPFCRKDTRTNRDGSFQIEGSETPVPAVVVVEAQGFARKVIPIKGGAVEPLGNIELTKEETNAPAALSVAFQERAKRNVRVVVDGKAQPVAALPPGARLNIGKLTIGTWGVRIRENQQIAVDKLTVLSTGENIIHVPKLINFSNDEPEEPPIEPMDEDSPESQKDH